MLIKGKANIGVPCVIPFTLLGKTYHSCTYDFHHTTGYKPWCSTKVDENGIHVTKNPDGTNNWGTCLEDDLNCPIPPRRKFD